MLMKTAPNGFVACHYTDALSTTAASPVTFNVATGCVVQSVMPTLMFTTVLNANPAPEDSLVVCNTLQVIKSVNTNAIELFPVPANDLVTIDLGTTALREMVLINVTDLLGKSEMRLNVKPTSNKIQLDVARFATGTYVVSIVMHDETTVCKIIVQK